MNTSEVDLVKAQESGAEPGILRKRSRKRNITIFVVVTLLNVTLLGLLWWQLLTPAANQSSPSTNGTSGLGDVSSPLLGKQAPDFTLGALSATSKGSEKIHLNSFKGQPVIVNFWASWCGPCNDEVPFLQKSWPQLQAQHVAFIGIDSNDGHDSAVQFLQKYHVSYPNAEDPKGTTAVNYGTTGYPETFFINRNGIIAARWIKPLDAKGLQLELAKIIHS